MIPRVIHYCWFGRGELPRSARRCIASWRKYCPDYEIRRWDEDNFDVNMLPYTAQAYAAGKYAYVSDYARFWVLNKFGGLYFDTDVELIRPIDDIVACGPFMGFETGHMVAAGLGLGLEAGMPIVQQILDRYAPVQFIMPDGTYNNRDTVVPIVTEIMLANGMQPQGTKQIIEGVSVYPAEFFNPYDSITGRLRKTANTRSIHWYTASWSGRSNFRLKAARLARRVFIICGLKR